ncbi:MAG: chemotaxis protein CheW, partial [Deltaproteobacteria bacterium]|nr:chemotaxis protein CheW [Deltaproteobacteria bacterium]
MSKDNGALQMVAFHSHGSEYAVELQTIQEIVRQGEISSLPSQSDFVEGVINLRGRVIQIVDLARKFAKGSGDAITNGKILVINTGGGGFGILVDNVSEVFSVEGDNIEPLSSMEQGGEYLIGVVKVDDRLLTLLDPLKLLSPNEMGSLENNVVSKEELDDGNVIVTKKEWGMGGEYLSKEILEKGQVLIDKKDMEGEGVDNMRATLEEVQHILEGFAGGDLPAVECSIQKINAIADKRLFNEVGKVTRNLHTSLKDFQHTIDPGIKNMFQQGIP